MSWKTSRCSHVLENKDIPHHLLLRNMTDMHRDQWKETKISRVQSFPYKKKKKKVKNKTKQNKFPHPRKLDTKYECITLWSDVWPDKVWFSGKKQTEYHTYVCFITYVWNTQVNFNIKISFHMECECQNIICVLNQSLQKI